MKCRNNTWIMLISLIIFPFLSVSQSKQIDFSYENNLSRYAKVWGLLKYYHPEIAKGTIDWDSVLVNNIPHLKTTDSKEKFNSEIIKLFNIAGDVNIYDTLIPANPDSVKRYPDFDWIQDSIYFSVPMIKKMEFIIDNKVPFDNYYVQVVGGIGGTSYENEKAYENMGFPDEEYRLLALFRYWNVINYFFPYKHLMDRNWHEVLDEFLNRFIIIEDSISLNLLIAELISNINDTHAITTDFFWDFLGSRYIPLELYFVENKTVVSNVLTEYDTITNNIHIGDILLEINNIQINELRNYIARYISASNNSSKQYLINAMLTRNREDSVYIKLQRNGQTIYSLIKSLNYEEIRTASYLYHRSFSPYKQLSEKVAYINLTYLNKVDVDSIMAKAVKSKAIIFDLRGYPRNTLYMISEYLNPYKSDFSLTYKPDINYPGLFRYSRIISAGPDEYNANFYKGIVAILINEKTQSHGEFTCMALQTAADVCTIGTQTAGADGNVSKLVLPGKIEVYFSGIGIAYPNGQETQRIGIIPDINIFQNYENIKNGNDIILDKAIEYIYSCIE